jgi:hypothetical protein
MRHDGLLGRRWWIRPVRDQCLLEDPPHRCKTVGAAAPAPHPGADGQGFL